MSKQTGSDSILADLVNNLVIQFNASTANDDNIQYILNVYNKSLFLEGSALFVKSNAGDWKLISAVGQMENCDAIKNIVTEKYRDFRGGPVVFSGKDIDNIALIPIDLLGSEYCMCLINKKYPIDVDLYYLSQQLMFIKNIFKLKLNSVVQILTNWKRAFFSGSRNSILNRALNCYRWFDSVAVEAFDFIFATGIDSATQLMISSPKQISSTPGQNFNEITPCGEPSRFMQFALLRKRIWENVINGKICESTVNESVNILNATSSTNVVVDMLYRPESPDFKNAILNNSMREKLVSFLFDNYFELEHLKTYLFLVHNLASVHGDVVDGGQIEIIDSLFFREYGAFTSQQRLVLLLQRYLDCWGKASGASSVITSEWLFFWFGLKMLTSVSLFKDVNTKYPPDFRSKFYQHFSCYYLYLLFLIRCLGEPALFRFSDVSGGFEAFISASLFLMAEYTHQEEGLDVTIPLHSALRNIWSKEAILYTVRDGYRDHFHHVWNVCLLGMVLIDAGLLARIDPEWGSYNEMHKQKIRRNWLLAGLLHDVGYCLDLNRHLLSHLDIFSKVPSISYFSNKLVEFFSEAEKALCAEMARNFNFYNGRKLDHGITSSVAIHYLDRLDASVVCDDPSKKWLNEIAMASEAIAKHNLKDVVIKPQESPLAFLLLLCDHLQEWDRPRLSGNKLRRSFSVQFNRPRQGQTTGHDIVRYLQCNICWKHNSIHMSAEDLVLKLIYKDAAKEEFEPAMIWCQNSEDFQRIDFGSFPEGFHIKFSLAHPVSDRLVRLSRSEMQLFEDFCRQDDSYLYLVQWCVHSKDCCYNYFCDRISKSTYELFIWEFSKAKFLNRIDYIPSNTYKKFVDWKEAALRKLCIVNATNIK